MSEVIDIGKAHYRLIEVEGEVTVVCVQDFDYPDYTFVSVAVYNTEFEAQEAADWENYPYEEFNDLGCSCACECCGCQGYCQQDDWDEGIDYEEEDD